MFDHEFLAQMMSTAIAVTVADGEKKTQEIRVK